MSFKGKRILITAGPTWVPIDKVRVISNIATGKTGLLLAERLNNLGAKTTLLLGPVGNIANLAKKIKIIRFRFFDELKNIIIKELSSKKYDMVIHLAAVSDYRPQITYAYKVKSGKSLWQLNLIPTEKLINRIKKIDQDIFLVGFKFKPQANKNRLIEETKILIQDANTDLTVANTIKKNKYQAYIINQRQIYGPLYSREKLVAQLIKVMRERSEQ